MSEDKSRLTFTQDYSAYERKAEGVYDIRESEWARIKRMVGEIKPLRNWLQSAGSICATVFVAAGFALVGFSYSKDVPSWALITTWVALVAGLVLTPILFFLDSQVKGSVTRSAGSVIDEMELLEKAYVKGTETTPLSSLR